MSTLTYKSPSPTPQPPLPSLLLPATRTNPAESAVGQTPPQESSGLGGGPGPRSEGDHATSTEPAKNSEGRAEDKGQSGGQDESSSGRDPNAGENRGSGGEDPNDKDKGKGAADEAEASGNLNLVWLDHPQVPLDQDGNVGLPKMFPRVSMVDEDVCPETLVWYHGSWQTDELHSFCQRGVVARWDGGGFYSPEPATYWSSSSKFAIWWAAMITVKDKAAREVLNWTSLHSIDKRRIVRDLVPKNLGEVPCIVVASTWSKADMYNVDAWVLDPTEEEEV